MLIWFPIPPINANVWSHCPQKYFTHHSKIGDSKAKNICNRFICDRFKRNPIHQRNNKMSNEDGHCHILTNA